MFIKKNLAILFVLAILITTMAACGSATPSEPAAEASRNEDVSAESPTQSESEESDPATQPSSEAESPASTDAAYVSADNFWQGDDYFDLEEYLWQNGATSMKKGYYDVINGELIESDSNVNYYQAQFDSTRWIVQIHATVYFECFGYWVNGNPFFGPGYVAASMIPHEEQTRITVNEAGMWLNDATIEILDDMLRMTKEHTGTDNPFQYSEKLNQSYTLATSDTDIPAGAVWK